MSSKPRWRSRGTNGAMRAARICSRVQRLVLREWFIAVISPMGLNEDPVDLLEIDGADLIAHGLDQRTEAEIAGAAQQALGGADNEGQGVRGEGIVAQARAVQLRQDELLGGLWPQAQQDDRIGDAG